MEGHLRGKDKTRLRSWLRSTSIAAGLAQRARIVLLAGDGIPNVEIAQRVGVSRPTVNHWRDRYLEGGVAALHDRPRSGRTRPSAPERDPSPSAPRGAGRFFLSGWR